MNNLARQELYFKKFLTINEMLERIEQVTAEEIQALADAVAVWRMQEVRI